ncbi:MAG: helix-turn-helix domain-containing protein [Bryobacteraceae bacterium]|jgi:excisionase family DNA binding protein
MPESYFRTGQAAKQLGVSSYRIRRLCEAGEITAEITDGQQYKIPASEIVRLQREGLPEVPVELDDNPDDFQGTPHSGTDSGDVPDGLLAAPSAELIGAAEEVKIVESRLQKRRIEKEAEEVEDWFRDRDRRQAALQAAERRKAEAAQAEQRRRKWIDSWIQYALNSRPYDAPRETELDLHQAVQTALASAQPDQPRYTTQRLVDAAVERALRPWRRKTEIRKAIESAIRSLPWEINDHSEWALLKNRALEAAAAAINKLQAEATGSEMRAAATLAVEPVAREYAHWQTCHQLAAWVTLGGGTTEEVQEARHAVAESLAQLPVGTPQKQLEKTREATLEPFHAAIQRRKAETQQRDDQARQEREKARQRADAERRVGWRLSHVGVCLQKLEQEGGIEFDDFSDQWELQNKLRERIRAILVEEVLENGAMSDRAIDKRVEKLIDKHLAEFLEA